MLCLHHNDADGLCAGAIVRRRFGDDVHLHVIDYGLAIPWHKIEQAETVIVTDFSLLRSDMETIYQAKGDNLIWIDHHISAIKDMAHLPQISGIRDVDKAACVLTWEYFFPDKPVPQTVSLIGDRDIWRFDYPETKSFSEGLFYAEADLANIEFWQALLNDDVVLTQQLIEEGQLLYKARMKDVARQVKSHGFETTFHDHKTLAVNLPSNGDVGHYICGLGYDVAYVYRDRLEGEQVVTSVTLYSEVIDVSVLAKAHGGGGHKGAAGFRFVRTGNRPMPA